MISAIESKIRAATNTLRNLLDADNIIIVCRIGDEYFVCADDKTSIVDAAYALSKSSYEVVNKFREDVKGEAK